MRILILSFFITFSLSINLEGKSLNSMLDSLIESDKSTFTEIFPYNEYLDSFTLDNVKEFEVLRKKLNQKGISGDDFIFNLFEHYWAKQATDFYNIDTLEEALRIAEVFNCSNQYISDDVYIYDAVSSLIFDTVSDTLQSIINNGNISYKEPKINYLLYRLQRYNYYIDIREGNWSKLWRYTKQGRFDYIWHKFNTTYKKEFYTAVIIGLPSFLIFLFLVFRLRRKRKRQKKAKQQP